MATNNKPAYINISRLTNRQLKDIQSALYPDRNDTVMGKQSHSCCGKLYREVWRHGSNLTTLEAQHYTDCPYYLVVKELQKPEREEAPPPPPMPTYRYRLAQLDDKNWCIIDQLNGNKVIREKRIGELYTPGKYRMKKVAHAHRLYNDLEADALELSLQHGLDNMPERRFELVDINSIPHVFKIVDRLRADKVVKKREVKSHNRTYINKIRWEMISEVEQLNEENPGGIAFDREYFPQEDAA